MAGLPSGKYMIQQLDGEVVLFENHTERELTRFDPYSADESAKAQKLIYDLTELSPEDKAFAHFWSGYFYGQAKGGF